jgi:hypothetical protein
VSLDQCRTSLTAQARATRAAVRDRDQALSRAEFAEGAMRRGLEREIAARLALSSLKIASEAALAAARAEISPAPAEAISAAAPPKTQASPKKKKRRAPKRAARRRSAVHAWWPF